MILDSNLLVGLFTGFSTIFTGVIAWVIYLRTKVGQKRDAAIILVSEIRHAESAVDDIKKNKVINGYTSLLPNNSWYNYKHLFVKNFDGDEIKLLDSFFLRCSLAEEQIRIFKNYENLSKEESIKAIQHKLIELMDSYRDDGSMDANEKYKGHRGAILELFHNETYWFQPNAAEKKIVEYIMTMSSIINTSVWIKLKKIAKV